MTQPKPMASENVQNMPALTRNEPLVEHSTPPRSQEHLPNTDELPQLPPVTPTPMGNTPVYSHSNRFQTLKSHRSMPHMGTIKLPVSLAFKRTCYKCGNLGHHADECESKERLCYNCKQPGHESSKCPNDRSTVSKQCYFCKEMGHIQSECQQYRILRQERYVAQPLSPQPSSAQILYYSNMRNQMPPPHPMQHRVLRHAPSQTQFYYTPPPQMGHYPQYPPPPPQSQLPLPRSPHPLQRQPSMPQMFYPQPRMRQGDYIPSATQHYGNQLISMRGYPMPPTNTSMCYTCGEQGHESKECTRR